MDKSKKPPAQWTEGEHYIWDEFRQAYVGEMADGTLVIWNPDSGQWGTMRRVSEETPTPEQGRAISKGLGEQPAWWDDEQDGPFPDWWDKSLYGPFPHLTDKEGRNAGPDYDGAIKRADAIDKRTEKAAPKGKGKVVEGSTVGAPPGTWWIQDPDGSLKPWTPEKTQGEGEIVTIGGQQFIKQPNGTLVPYNPETPETTKPNWDDEYEKLLIQAAYGDENAKQLAISLRDTRQLVERGKMTEAEADAFIGTLPISVPEMRAWRDALMGDRAVVTGEPATNPNPFTPALITTNQFGQATGSNVFPGAGQPPEGWVVSANGRFYDPENHVWEDWDEFQERMAPFQAGGEGALPAGSSASDIWLRSRKGQVMPDPNPGTSTPGRFYDPIGHEWEPMDAYNERMARFKAAQAQQPAPVPVPTTGTADVTNWGNVPPVGWGTARFVPNDQWNAMTPEERNAYFEPGGAGYVAPEQQFAEAAPLRAAAQARQTPVASATSTTQQTQFGKPQRVTQAAGSTPQDRMAMWNRGDMAQYEQNLFGLPKLSAGDAAEQIWAREFGRKKQKRFEATPVPRASYR